MIKDGLSKRVEVQDYKFDMEQVYDTLATKEFVQDVKDEFDNLPKLDQCMLEIYNLQ